MVKKFSNDEDIKKIEAYIDESKELLFSLLQKVTLEDKWIVKKYIDDLERIKIEMTQGLYFVTIQGSLKTGKSTLTNLLAGAEVAVTAAGTDTTKIPYIITKSRDDNARIILYKLKSNTKIETKNYKKETQSKLKEIIRSIIDDIKGINVVSNKNFIKKEVDFNRKTIEKYTVHENNESVLLINIQIPRPKTKSNWILDYHIGILDTPGVEGEKANKHEMEISEIRNRTNMLIIMQSTVTPLNSIEIEELKNYYKNNVSSVRLLHNRFMLFPWRKEEDLKKFYKNEEKSIIETHKEIETIFGKTPYKSIDLAKVADYIKFNDKYKEKLEEEYKEFISFEKEIIKVINEERIEQKSKKAIKDLKSKVREIIDENSELNKLIFKYKKIKTKIEKNKSEIDIQFEAFYKKLDNLCPTIIINLEFFLRDLLNSLPEKYFSNLSEYIKPEKTNKFFLKKNISLSEETINKIKKFLNNGEYKLKKDIENAILNKLQSEVDKYLSDSLKNINKILEDFCLLKLEKLTLQKDIIPNIKIDNFTDEEIKNSIHTNKLGDKLFIFEEYEIDVELTKERLIKKIENALISKKDMFINSLIFELNEKVKEFKKIVAKKKEEVDKEYNLRNKKALNQATEVIKSFNTVKEKLRNLEITI